MDYIGKQREERGRVHPFSGMRTAGRCLKMWSNRRRLMCFRVVLKVGGVIGLNSALLAGICMFFLVGETSAQNTRSGAAASPAGVRRLAGHVPTAAAQLTPQGDVQGDQRLALAISLPLRNPGRLEQFLRELYDPASTNY